jgi:hypothetical protein
LACTKAPPNIAPIRAMGVGSCVAPRNHDGPCEYEWNGGRLTLEVTRGPSPMDRAAEIESLYRRARKYHLIAMVCCAVLVFNAVHQVLNMIGAALP